VKRALRKATIGIAGDKKVCTGRDLAVALVGVKLSDAEARAWHRDLASARKSLKPFHSCERSRLEGC
jgi:hypothetical protein